MDYEALLKEKLQQYPRRIKHTYGVLKRALELGRLYNADLKVLKVAALLHDITKHENLETHKELIDNCLIIDEYHPSMLHAFSGAVYAEKLGITDKKIIEAIKYHIFGKIKMNIETMILCVSDACEENRKYPEADLIYKTSLIDLQQAFILTLEITFNYLKENNYKVHNEQIKVYNYYKGKEKDI